MNINLNLKDPENRNLFYLGLEVILGGFFTAVFSFGTVYALRLGATDNEVGYITAFPALIVAFLAIPFGGFLQKAKKPNHWILISHVLQRILFFIVVLIPLLIQSNNQTGTIVVIIIIFSTIPQLLYNLTIFPFYMQVVKEDKRISFFSATNFSRNLITGIIVAISGVVLDRLAFPLNYQLVFTSGIIISFISLFCFFNVRDPETGKPIIQSEYDHRIGQPEKFINQISLRTNLGRAIINQFLQYIGIWAATPVIIIYIINHLHASDSWFGFYNSLMFWGLLAGWMIARIIVKRFGEPITLKWASQLPSLQPLLVGLSSTLAPILLVNLFSGLVSPVYGLSHNNSLLKAFPPGQEHQAMAIYSSISRIGIFLFSLMGVSVLNYTNNIRLVLISCGIISLMGSFSFHFFPVFPNSSKTKRIDHIPPNEGAETNA